MNSLLPTNGFRSRVVMPYNIFDKETNMLVSLTNQLVYYYNLNSYQGLSNQIYLVNEKKKEQMGVLVWHSTYVR